MNGAAPSREPGRVDVVVGIQWGDEGKGRVVDLLAADYDVVARFAGGDNAGHSIHVGDQHLALRIVPSGALVPHAQLLVGGGTVVSLATLVKELDALAAIGVDVERIKVSDRAHVVLPHHGLRDRRREVARGAAAIGTTGRGIGPAYVDKVAREGLMIGDLARADVAAAKIRASLAAAAPFLEGDPSVPTADEEIAETLELWKRIRPHVVDGVAFLHGALERGARVLAEGAQGTMLDVGYGTYPYVTSSHTIAGSACIGLGVGPTRIGRVVGVAKAYCTRVGGGPFPSELSGAEAERLRAEGREYGVVTGRPRRVGWFDLVAARYAARVNGLTSIILTKLDVLSAFERIGVVQAYRRDGAPVEDAATVDPVEVEVRWFPGWSEPLDAAAGTIAALPEAARAYVEFLQTALGVRADLVSIGPERSAFVR